FTFKNRYAFSSLANKIDFLIELYDKDGNIIEKIRPKTPNIEPNSEENVHFDELNGLNKSVFSLRLVYSMKYTNIELGFDTVPIKEFKPTVNNTATSKLIVTETMQAIQIKLDNREIHLSKITGGIHQLIDQKRSLLEEPSNWAIWRAPIDNDQRIRREWE